jgi:hypothetical protein
MNDEKLFDVLIRDVGIVVNGQRVQVDLGIQREELSIPGTTEYYSKGIIGDIGDLQEWFGFEEVAAEQLVAVGGKTLPMDLTKWQELEESEQLEYIKAGNLYLLEKESAGIGKNSNELINIVPDDVPAPLEFEETANFLLINRSGEIRYVILNGFLWPIDQSPPEGLNGLIIS